MEPADNRISRIKRNSSERECFIEESIPFILRCASLSAGRYITREDDVFAVGLEAFDKAIESHDESKGKFRSYAGVCIKNAITDYYRSQKKHRATIRFSELSAADDKDTDTVVQLADNKTAISDTSVEILSLKEELSVFGISFFDLPKSSPPTPKTKKYCIQISRYIAADKGLSEGLYRKKQLPVKEITQELNINKKVPERYRQYIITGVIILKGDYEILKEYFLAGGVK